MSILDRIRAHGGEVIRREYRLTLRRGRLNDAALRWLGARWQNVCREAWPEFDDWDERAAIREYEGGMPRAEAEAAAYRDVMGRT